MKSDFSIIINHNNLNRIYINKLCNKILFKTKLVYVTTCISDKKLNKHLIII